MRSRTVRVIFFVDRCTSTVRVPYSSRGATRRSSSNRRQCVHRDVVTRVASQLALFTETALNSIGDYNWNLHCTFLRSKLFRSWSSVAIKGEAREAQKGKHDLRGAFTPSGWARWSTLLPLSYWTSMAVILLRQQMRLPFSARFQCLEESAWVQGSPSTAPPVSKATPSDVMSTTAAEPSLRLLLGSKR